MSLPQVKWNQKIGFSGEKLRISNQNSQRGNLMDDLIKRILVAFLLLFLIPQIVIAHEEQHHVTINCTDVFGIKNVTLILYSPLGEEQIYHVFDDGEHGDNEAKDSIFGTFINTSEEGLYNYKFICIDNHDLVGESDLFEFYHSHLSADSTMKTKIYFGREFWDNSLLITNPFDLVDFKWNYSVRKPVSNLKIEIDGKNIWDLREFEDSVNRYYISNINLPSGQTHLHYTYEREKIPFIPSNFILLPFGFKIPISKFPFDEYRLERNIPPACFGEYVKKQTIIIDELEEPYILNQDKSGLFTKRIISWIEPTGEENVTFFVKLEDELLMNFNYVDGDYVLSIDRPKGIFMPRMILFVTPPNYYKYSVYGGFGFLILFIITRILSPIKRVKKGINVAFNIFFNKRIPILGEPTENFYWVKSGITALGIFIILENLTSVKSPIIMPYEALNVDLTLLDWQTWIAITLIYIVSFTVLEKSLLFTYSKRERFLRKNKN